MSCGIHWLISNVFFVPVGKDAVTGNNKPPAIAAGQPGAPAEAVPGVAEILATAKAHRMAHIVWRNPTFAEFSAALAAGEQSGDGLRALLTATDITVWWSHTLLHQHYVKTIGADGVRLWLKPALVLVSEETICKIDQFPWISMETATDPVPASVARRTAVFLAIQNDPRLRALYPTGFRTGWYIPADHRGDHLPDWQGQRIRPAAARTAVPAD